MTRGSLHTRSFRRIHVSFFRYRLAKNGFAGSKRFRVLVIADSSKKLRFKHDRCREEDGRQMKELLRVREHFGLPRETKYTPFNLNSTLNSLNNADSCERFALVIDQV